MSLRDQYPDDVFIYVDPETQDLARRLVFDLEVDCKFKSTQTSSEIDETISEITAFMMRHLGQRVLVETEERTARVLCAKAEHNKLILIAFVNMKEDLSPYEACPWAISITPQRESVEKYISIFLGFCLYD